MESTAYMFFINDDNITLMHERVIINVNRELRMLFNNTMFRDVGRTIKFNENFHPKVKST